jgi:hypothetical protein
VEELKAIALGRSMVPVSPSRTANAHPSRNSTPKPAIDEQQLQDRRQRMKDLKQVIASRVKATNQLKQPNIPQTPTSKWRVEQSAAAAKSRLGYFIYLL